MSAVAKPNYVVARINNVGAEEYYTSQGMYGRAAWTYLLYGEFGATKYCERAAKMLATKLGGYAKKLD